jgi:Amt family ammonium transporter
MPGLVGAYLVLFMQAGFALLTCGLVRKKNAAHLVMLTLSAYVFAFIAYYAVGFAFEFGGSAVNAGPSNLGGTPTLDRFLIGSGHWGFVGGSGFFLSGAADAARGSALVLFEVAFMLIAAYILVGAICERITFGAFVLCELFVGGILYPVFGCWVWGGGWLSQLGSTLAVGRGYVDFAGSSVIHAVGGFCAMALAIILGPRLGKYGPDGAPRPFPAHNIVFVVIGTLILLFGWMGLGPGASPGTTDLRAAVIAVNTNLAAVGGAASAMLFWYLSFGKPDISMACNGMLAGLVAISASCAFVGPGAAGVIGVLAGLLACAGVLFNELVLKIDDPCGSISVHGYCGWLGAVAVGIFADGTYGVVWNGAGAGMNPGTAGQGVAGLLHGDVHQFVVQLGGASLCAAYAFGVTYGVFKVVDRLWPMRVDPEVEIEGLDLPEFGMLAYPEEEGSS